MSLPPTVTRICRLAVGDRLGRAALLSALLFSVACSPQIGDECSISTDCSSTGDRLCDTTQPGGYCTIFNCEPGSCPEESVCIGFRGGLASTCEDTQAEPRFQRLFCMASCESNADCRSGYVCLDLSGENDHGAEVLESGPSNSRVCVVPANPIEGNADNSTDVCTGVSETDSSEDDGG